jgi:hypothetical protein
MSGEADTSARGARAVTRTAEELDQNAARLSQDLRRALVGRLARLGYQHTSSTEDSKRSLAIKPARGRDSNVAFPGDTGNR